MGLLIEYDGTGAGSAQRDVVGVAGEGGLDVSVVTEVAVSV